jgi:hypothetical protein
MKIGISGGLVLAAALMLGGCAGRAITATTYGPMALFGGYKDREIEPGVWRIVGTSNGPAGYNFGRNVALYRAAELLKGQGFSHFQVLDQKGKTTMVGYGAPTNFAGETLTLVVRGVNDPAAPLACRAKLAERCATLAADTVIANVGPKLAFRKGQGPAR